MRAHASSPSTLHPFFQPPTPHPPSSNSDLARAGGAPMQPPFTNATAATADCPSLSVVDGDSRQSTRVVPPENPGRQLNVSDNGDDSGGDGDGDGDGEGLGEDDDGVGDEDEDEDEQDEEASPTDRDCRRRRRQPLPSWLQEAFHARVAELNEREDGVPLLYARDKTFWFPKKASYFILRDGAVSPSSLYNPTFFAWDPKALYKDLPCPYCRHVLNRHGVMSRPRRVVDINSTFYVIGFRYRCRHCLHPKTRKPTVTFRSWDSRILAVLPPPLAAEFPARLTHRSGMSAALFSWMRSCFQCGMGPKRFSDALRVQHLLRYDTLQLQYLEFIAGRALERYLPGSRKYEAFLPFDDASSGGPHGFVPNAAWLRDVYDRFIEEHRQDFDQHTAMLSGTICAIDHSFKVSTHLKRAPTYPNVQQVTKHVAKVNGERIFTALLTVTNEYGEIRVCNLVATKSHSQFELSLREMAHSLDLYGHPQPALFFTDNMADKAFLESSFPSLRNGIVPVEKHGNLEPFVLPSDVQILPRAEEAAINAALSTIIDELPIESSDPDLILGFDCEWNVAISDVGRVERGEIAIVQIAYQKRVFILQVCVAHSTCHVIFTGALD